jgi:glyoxylase-like metal-dependent hydrolase (beta-lactamase superfamily II)
LRTIVAANASAMTLDGTRTYIVGTQRVAVIDPGPRLDRHLHGIVEGIGSGEAVAILLTHSHPDHAEAAAELARLANAPVRSAAARTLQDGDVITTDAGSIRALATPGHTPDHFSFWWPQERALFCGDLMMGGMDTALVARPEGDLNEYLQSLRLLKSLSPRILYPAHGPPFDDPAGAIDRYIAHREARIGQVVDGLKDGPLSADALLEQVYGTDLDPRLRPYAETAVEAYLAYLRAQQRVRESASGVWSLL